MKSEISAAAFSPQSILATWWQIEGELDQIDSDLTTKTTTEYSKRDPSGSVSFEMQVKKPGIFSGRSVLDWIATANPNWKFSQLPQNGAQFEKQECLLRGEAPLGELLGRERMILNLLQHLSGIATATNNLCREIEKHWNFESRPPQVFHTRKFLPFLRSLQLEACLHGGGARHRVDLADRILFKDNHKNLLKTAGLSFSDYLKFLQERNLLTNALIEVENEEEGHLCLKSGVAHLMLDNFSPDQVRKFCESIPASSLVSIEISGSLTVENVAAYLVHPRVQRLSFGALTHSVRALDISLEISL